MQPNQSKSKRFIARNKLTQYEISYDSRTKRWKAGKFPPVKESEILKRIRHRKDTERIFERMLCAMAYRADGKEISNPDKIFWFVSGDVLRGKAPPKKCGKWEIREIREIREIKKAGRCRDREFEAKGDLLDEAMADLLSNMTEWARECAEETRQIQAEREAEGYDPGT